ncbi:Uncharacterised protein [Vibrio cholerae]|nr:Uncharacterised protein [Vibrio cholerae]
MLNQVFSSMLQKLSDSHQNRATLAKQTRQQLAKDCRMPSKYCTESVLSNPHL